MGASLDELRAPAGVRGPSAMVPFRENTFYLFAWRAFLTALIGLVLMATRSVEVAAALLIGANVALLFSFGLIVWSEQLTEERIVWTEAWRMLKPSNGRWPSRPQVGAPMPQRHGVALRRGRIGFGDCFVCISAHACERVAAVATATEKELRFSLTAKALGPNLPVTLLARAERWLMTAPGTNVDFRFRGKSSHAADISATTEFDRSCTGPASQHATREWQLTFAIVVKEAYTCASPTGRPRGVGD
jgi:hypothetical protein